MTEKKGDKESAENKGGGLTRFFVVVIIVLLIAVWYMNSKECEVCSEPVECNCEDEENTGGYCENYVVPEKVIFRTAKTEIDGGARIYGDLVSAWKDGTPITTPPGETTDFKCDLGDEELEQDSSYYYCDNLYY